MLLRAPMEPSVGFIPPRLPPLRASEEKNLARRLRASRGELKASPRPRRNALLQYQGARTELIERNLRLVIAVANQYRHLGMELDDLVQEGSIGLLRAVERFDPNYEVKFSTYAVWWIRQAITRALSTKARTIRIPIRLGQLARKVNRLGSAIAARVGQRPRLCDLARDIGVSLHQLQTACAAWIPVESLDAPALGDGSPRWQLQADSRASSPWSMALETETCAKVRDLIQMLPPREQLIVGMRFAVGYPRTHTLEEVGKALHLTRERVRQIERAALSRLRREGEARGLHALVTG